MTFLRRELFATGLLGPHTFEPLLERTDRNMSDASPAHPAARFVGKVAIVTGVSDRGIGGAIAERLAAEGAALAAFFHPDKPVRTLRKLVKLGQPVLEVPCDVTSNGSVAAAIDAVMGEFGQIDVLVNNAGVDRAQPMEDMSDADWDLTINVNLSGVMRITRAASKYLAEPGGVIVNVASALGLGGCYGFTAYSASKAGVIGMTQSLAMELAPRGQRAVCVAPALVHTPMAHKHIGQLTDEDTARIEAAHPIGVGMPADISAAVAFLASDEARWVTGVTLPLGYLNQFGLPGTAMLTPLESAAVSVEVESLDDTRPVQELSEAAVKSL